MNVDEEKVDQATLALMYMTLHDEDRVWKGFDWDVTDRLHEKDLISNPKTKAKSVRLTPDGMERAEELFEKFFANGSS